jgi:hypothetical protein
MNEKISSLEADLVREAKKVKDLQKQTKDQNSISAPIF